MIDSLKPPIFRKVPKPLSSAVDWVNLNPIFAALILVWILITGHIFLNSSALIADEYWYISFVKNKSIPEIFAIGNQFGYGQIFWLLLGALINFFGIWLTRLFFLLLYISSPLLLMSIAKTEGAKAGIFFLWISTTMAWWYGKIISPEIIIIFLTCLSLVWLHKGRILPVVILLALACSIKLSIVPFCLLVPFFIWRKFTAEKGSVIKALRPSFRVGLIALALFAVTFLIFNPLLFQGVDTFFKGYNLPTVGTSAVPENFEVAKSRVAQSFFAMRWGWDGVPLPGFFKGGFSFIVTCGLAFGFIFSIFKSLKNKTTDWMPLLGIIMAVGFLLLLVLTRSKFFTWYWFPAFVTIIYATVYFDFGSVRKTTLFVVVFASINLFQNTNVISDSLAMKYSHIRNTQAHADMTTCLNMHIAETDAKAVLDYAEVPRTRHYDAKKIGVAQVRTRSEELDLLFIGQRFLWKGVALNVLEDIKNPYVYRGQCEHVLVFEIIK